MHKLKKQKRLKRTDKLMNVLKLIILKRIIKQKIKSSKRKVARKENLMKLQGHVKKFMEAAFEPKTIKKERNRKKRIDKESGR